MITLDDIEAFEEKSAPAFKAGDAFVRRRKKGLPIDRWITGDPMFHLIADCIEYQRAIMSMQSDAIQSLMEEKAQRGDESMGVYDRNGNRTS